MAISRRGFLGTVGIGGAAMIAAPQRALAWPLADKPHRTTRAGFVLLNSNENAYGPFPSVETAAAEGLQLSNRYPFGQEGELQEQVAAYHKVANNQVVLGEGSTEILRAAVDAFTSPSRKLVMASPTFEAAFYYAQARGTPVAHVPLTSSFAHDLNAMLAAAGSHAGLIYICNPNNPTGSLTPRKDIEAFLGKLPRATHVLVDEAYHHFAGGPDYVSFLDRPVDDPRVIVARTFSKVYAMAGLRLGYGIGTPPTIKQMERCLTQDNANMVALYCAMAALKDEAATRTAVERNTADRAEFLRQAEARKLRVVPSRANFVMMHTGRPVRDLIQHFRQHGILVGRPFPPMDDYVRISLGQPEEMQQFWAAWDKLPLPRVQ